MELILASLTTSLVIETLSIMQLTDQTICSCHFGSSSAERVGPSNERSSNADLPRNRFIIFPDTAVRQVITQRMTVLPWLRSLNPANPGNKLWGAMPATLTEETVQEADRVLSQLLLELRERLCSTFLHPRLRLDRAACQTGPVLSNMRFFSRC
jgi:hypothetical protein